MGAETNAATTTETTEETKQVQAPVVDGEGANKDATNTTTQTEPKQDENKQQPKYTDADVDQIVSKRLAKWEKQQAAKVEEAAKLAEMNAQQKAGGGSCKGSWGIPSQREAGLLVSTS